MKTNYIAGTLLAALLGLGLMPLQANAQTKYPRPKEVNRRLENQHDRIHQGVRSGALNRRETRNLRLADARVRYQEQRDRINHNGHLTTHEYRQINREMNRNSNRIYRDKH